MSVPKLINDHSGQTNIIVLFYDVSGIWLLRLASSLGRAGFSAVLLCLQFESVQSCKLRFQNSAYKGIEVLRFEFHSTKTRGFCFERCFEWRFFGRPKNNLRVFWLWFLIRSCFVGYFRFLKNYYRWVKFVIFVRREVRFRVTERKRSPQRAWNQSKQKRPVKLSNGAQIRLRFFADFLPRRDVWWWGFSRESWAAFEGLATETFDDEKRWGGFVWVNLAGGVWYVFVMGK